MGLKLANNATSRLSAGISPTDTTIVLLPGGGAAFPALGDGDYFPATIVKVDGTLEIVKVTARSADVLTVARAQENTTAKAFNAGDRIELRLTAGAFSDMSQDVDNHFAAVEADISSQNNLRLSGSNLTLSPQWSDIPELVTDNPSVTDELNGQAKAVGNRTLLSVRWANTITSFDGTGVPNNAIINFSGRDAVDDGAGGPLRFLAGSTITADGGTVYAVTGGRLVRDGWSVFGIRPEWFGNAAGNIRKAVDALPASGGLVLLGDRVYPPSYTDYTGTAGVGYLAKANVRIQGSKTPKAKSDLTGLEGGTIIQGPFFVFADGFEVDKIGVDSGAVVCDSLYGGVAQEGFVHFKPGQSTVTPAANTVTVGDVVAITQSFSAPVHSILLEGIDNLQFSNLRAYLGTHGVVIKSKNVNGANVFTKGNSSDGLICKSDAYANMMHVNIQNVLVEAVSDALEAGFGVLVEAVGAVGGQVNIGNIRAYKKNVALSMRSNGNAMNDINVTGVISEGCTTGVQYGGDIRRTHVGSLIVNNFGQAVYVAPEVTSATNSIGVVKATNGIHIINGDGKLSIGHVDADNVSGQMFYYGNTGVRLLIGTYTQVSSPNVWALNQTLLNGWVNHVPEGGNSQFSILPWAGEVVISGLIAGGTSGTIANLSVQIRPDKNLRFIVLGHTGGTNKWVPIEIIIGTDGNITATNYTDAPGYISMDGIRYPIPT